MQNKVDEICEELGVNQRELADIMGTSQNSVSNWKNGKQSLPPWAIKMFKLLKIEKEHLELTRTIKRYKI